MTNYEFNSLGDDEKANVIWSGTFIAERYDEGHFILLYQVESFYVEVFYKRGDNLINAFRSFTTTQLLEPYLPEINFFELLNQ